MLHRSLPLILLLVIGVAGCFQTPILYAPPVAHVPMLRHGGDVDVSASLSGIPGADLRVSISPVDHLSLMALGSWLDRRFDSSEHAYHRYVEFGVGTYLQLGQKFLGELVAGYGSGHAVGFGRDYRGFGDPPTPAWPVSGDYRRYFIQADLAYIESPSASFRTEFGGFGVVLRAANVAFDPIVERDSITTGEGWFFEPVLVIRRGVQVVQAEVQLGLSSKLNRTAFEGIDLFGSVGMRVALQELF